MITASRLSVVVERHKTLLSGVTLELRPGEVLALAGENGAGKSTLLKALAGDLAFQGEVTLNGRPLAAWSLRARARLRAVLPQHSAVAFGFSALEIALLGRYPRCHGLTGAADVAAARAALERMDAGHLAGRRFDTLSGGERARVMMARALAQIWEDDGTDGPRYLLLDEPVASLDLAHQHHALRVAREFAREAGAGVLAVLHDLNLAAQYADRIVVLKQGRVAAAGAPDSVLTEELVAECFAMRSRVMRHPGLDCPLVVPMPEPAA